MNTLSPASSLSTTPREVTIKRKRTKLDALKQYLDRTQRSQLRSQRLRRASNRDQETAQSTAQDKTLTLIPSGLTVTINDVEGSQTLKTYTLTADIHVRGLGVERSRRSTEQNRQIDLLHRLKEFTLDLCQELGEESGEELLLVSESLFAYCSTGLPAGIPGDLIVTTDCGCEGSYSGRRYQVKSNETSDHNFSHMRWEIQVTDLDEL